MTSQAVDDVGRLGEMIRTSGKIVVFTGAGISTESGIADFRSPGGIWSKIKPIRFSEFVANPERRLEDWRRRFYFQAEFDRAVPNEGHHAVTSIVNSEAGLGLITQNIDGLHQRSGVAEANLIEIHGNGTRASCLDCGSPMPMSEAKSIVEASGAPPDCNRCGGIVKADIISFGQPMPADKVVEAERLAGSCDLFIVLGSSLVVQPAATLPMIAHYSGARMAIVNREPTPVDSLADIVIHASIGETMKASLLP